MRYYYVNCLVGKHRKRNIGKNIKKCKKYAVTDVGSLASVSKRCELSDMDTCKSDVKVCY